MCDYEWDDGKLQRRNPHAADGFNPLPDTREGRRTRLMSNNTEPQPGRKGNYGPCCQRQSFHEGKFFRLLTDEECNNFNYIERSIWGFIPEYVPFVA